MQPLLQNKYLRYGGSFFILIFIVLIIVAIVLGSLNDARSTGLSSGYSDSVSSYKAESFDRGMAMNDAFIEQAYYAPEQPRSGNYTSDLETYETTSYSVTARTKQFDELCTEIKNLKEDPSIHFKSLQENTNNCNSTFFVEKNKADTVLSVLTSYKGVEYTRNTNSVTRHKQYLQSQTSIVQQQLNNVQRSLDTAETQLENLTNAYANSQDVATLSLRVNESLRLIDQLNQRKVNFNNQLNNLYQQSADLEQRISVIEFTVNINRSNPIYQNRDSQKWEHAWTSLQNTFTDTLIGITASLGIFVLWTLRISLYLIIAGAALRALWKLAQFVKRKW